MPEPLPRRGATSTCLHQHEQHLSIYRGEVGA
ncbi:hypothetical protein SFR_6959 (plasmid) [Streptomyces sp. FR-008]|nr:hypothetical protein SFR_6959 [Streptomyces sp. FR-008]